MKTIVTLSALALISNIALAESFEYENQIGSQDLDPNISTSAGIRDAEASSSSVRVSLNDWYKGNPDVVHVPYNHDGIEMKFEGDLFTSYDALSLNNPDLEA